MFYCLFPPWKNTMSRCIGRSLSFVACYRGVFPSLFWITKVITTTTKNDGIIIFNIIYKIKPLIKNNKNYPRVGVTVISIMFFTIIIDEPLPGIWFKKRCLLGVNTLRTVNQSHNQLLLFSGHLIVPSPHPHEHIKGWFLVRWRLNISISQGNFDVLGTEIFQYEQRCTTFDGNKIGTIESSVRIIAAAALNWCNRSARIFVVKMLRD